MAKNIRLRSQIENDIPFQLQLRNRHSKHTKRSCVTNVLFRFLFRFRFRFGGRRSRSGENIIHELDVIHRTVHLGVIGTHHMEHHLFVHRHVAQFHDGAKLAG